MAARGEWNVVLGVADGCRVLCLQESKPEARARKRARTHTHGMQAGREGGADRVQREISVPFRDKARGLAVFELGGRGERMSQQISTCRNRTGVPRDGTDPGRDDEGTRQVGTEDEQDEQVAQHQTLVHTAATTSHVGTSASVRSAMLSTLTA